MGLAVVTAVVGQSSGGGSVGDAVIWIIVLVVCCVIFGVVLMQLRKHFLGADDDAGAGAVLPMSELRRLRDSGELSDEEYRRAVDVLASQARAYRSDESSGSPDRGS